MKGKGFLQAPAHKLPAGPRKIAWSSGTPCIPLLLVPSLSISPLKCQNAQVNVHTTTPVLLSRDAESVETRHKYAEVKSSLFLTNWADRSQETKTRKTPIKQPTEPL